MTRPRRQRALAVQTALETYLREINDTPLLTAADERDLGTKIKAGDAQARDRMIRANLRLVVNIARSYVGKGLGLQDLIEEGNLGLVRAVEGYDPTNGTRFSTYASYWIKQSIKRSLINTAKTIRIPAYMNERLVKWRQAAAKLQDRLGRVPTPDEVGKALRLPKKKIAIMKKAIRVYNAIPQTDHSEVGWSLDEIVTDGNSKPPEDDLIRSDDLTQLANLLKDLDAREADVLRMRFGMTEDSRPRTLTDIGKSMRITRERVRQIERDALDKLREKLRGS